MRNIACHSEVWVLINCGGDDAGNVSTLAINVRERVRETRGGLDGWERKFSDVVRLVEAKDALDLVEVYVFLNANHVWIELLNVINVTEDKGLLGVKAEGNDILDVAEAHRNRALRAFKVQLGTVDKFLIVGDLDHNGDVKSLLQILAHDEWDGVAQVKRLSRGSSASVEIEGLFGLVGLKDVVEVAVAEENTSA